MNVRASLFIIAAILLLSTHVSRSQLHVVTPNWTRLASPIQPVINDLGLTDQDTALVTWGEGNFILSFGSKSIQPNNTTAAYYARRTSSKGFGSGDTLFIPTKTGVQFDLQQSTLFQVYDPSFVIPIQSLIRDAKDVWYTGGMGKVYRSVKHHNDWQTLGPGLPTDSVIVLFASGDTLMAGTAQSGLFEYNAIQSVWVPVAQVSAYLIRSIIRAGTGLYVATRDEGCYMLDANGWQHLSGGDYRANQLIADHNNTVYVATDDGVFSVASGSTTLQRVDLPSVDVQRLLTAPNGDLYAWKTDAKIFRSVNHGLSWLDISVPVQSGTSVAVSEVSPNHLIALFNDGITFRSSDAGKRWRRAEPLTIQNGYTTALYPISASTILASIDYGQMAHSTNAGANWQLNALEGPCTEFAGVDSSVIFCVDAGIGSPSRTTNKGASWQQILAIHGKIFHMACLDQKNIYASSDSGIYVSHDGGDNWTLGAGPFTSVYPPILTVFNNRVYAGSIDGFYKTDDQGTTWKLAFKSPLSPTTAVFRSDYFLISNGASFFRSTDQGNSWTLAQRPAAYTNRMDTDAVGILYASTKGSGVFRSADKGLSWQPLYLDRYFKSDPAISTTNYGGFTVTPLGSLIFSGSIHQLYRSTDLGNSWVRSDTIDTYQSGTIDLLSSRTSIVYRLGVDNLYYSTDDGMNWSTLQTFFNLFTPVTHRSMVLDHSDNLYIENRNLWEVTSGAMTVTEPIVANTIVVTDIAFDSTGTLEIVSQGGFQTELYTRHLDNSIVRRNFELPQADYSSIETDPIGNIYVLSPAAAVTPGVGYLMRFRRTFDWDTVKNIAFTWYGPSNIVLDKDQYLIAATTGGGIFRCATIASSSVPLQSETLEQQELWLSPNPCLGKSTLHSTLPFGNHASIDFLKADGTLVRTFSIDEGGSEFEINLNGLPSGLYIGHVLDDNRIIGPVKLILLR